MFVVIRKNKIDALIDSASEVLDEVHNLLIYEYKDIYGFEMDLDRVATDLRTALSDLIGVRL
jgi:hypothetical protein